MFISEPISYHLGLRLVTSQSCFFNVESGLGIRQYTARIVNCLSVKMVCTLGIFAAFCFPGLVVVVRVNPDPSTPTEPLQEYICIIHGVVYTQYIYTTFTDNPVYDICSCDTTENILSMVILNLLHLIYTPICYCHLMIATFMISLLLLSDMADGIYTGHIKHQHRSTVSYPRYQPAVTII